MTDTPKTKITKIALDQGHSESYGLLLHHTALLGPDPQDLEPESDEEHTEWWGYFKGLRSALFCLVMHEKQLDAEAAVLVVNQHLGQAMDVLRQFRADGSGE